AWLLAAQHGVALVEQPLMPWLGNQPVLFLHLAALAERRERIRVAGGFDVGTRNAALEHQPCRLRYGERVRLAPVRAGVDEDARRAVAARDLDEALAAHL